MASRETWGGGGAVAVAVGVVVVVVVVGRSRGSTASKTFAATSLRNDEESSS